MRIVTWNLARRPLNSLRSKEMEARLASEAPDIICLAEAREGSLAGLAGHRLTARGVRWDDEADDERKVVLWSRSPWSEPVDSPALQTTGAAIVASTETPLGPVQVVGVCMPDNFAWPPERGERPAGWVWSEHLAFLDALKPVLEALDPKLPAIIAGDFNQFFPMIWGSPEAHRRLADTLKHFTVVTHGDIQPIGEHVIDHIALSKHLRAASVRGVSRVSADGALFSDHFGVSVEIEAGGVQIFN